MEKHLTLLAKHIRGRAYTRNPSSNSLQLGAEGCLLGGRILYSFLSILRRVIFSHALNRD